MIEIEISEAFRTIEIAAAWAIVPLAWMGVIYVASLLVEHILVRFGFKKPFYR